MAKKKLQVWLPLLFSIIMISGMVIGYKLRENTSLRNFFTLSRKSPVQEVLDLISLKYVDKVGVDTIGNKAIDEILTQLDPHSVYIPASDLQLTTDDLRGNFSGIGVEFQLFNDTVNVLGVIVGGPSEKAGIQVGDKMLQVNDSIIIAGKNKSADDIRKILRGDKGSKVAIQLLRDGKQKKIIIERGTIPVASVDAAYMMTSTIGFIHINRFSETTYREFMQNMEKLQAKGLTKLILDLRGNGGGLLSQAVNIADEFIDGYKLIVYTQGAHAPKYEYHAKRDGLMEKNDAVILVDESSASASEVLSGALQDWDRGTIVGRRTFGKGLVQEQFGLSDGAGLRLTVARYYTPLGRNIQKDYSNGIAKYEEEVSKRFHDGEVLHGDTSKNAGPAFKTPKGRMVYGGGGITPDVYIPFDTTMMGKEVVKLYSKGTLSHFIYRYYIQHKPELAAYKQAQDLGDKFTAGENEWEALKAFAAKDSINLNNISARDKASIMRRIPGLLARQIWRFEGYYRVMNRTDEFVQKALEVLK